ncbi:hypothetical protein Cgig2_033014 [Carnegiea gigantea]|uniref:Fe2OG dioxygenase domain-containing protein n=1 Tax=Carnegiea gigantea TaxID=171969 RepID=A0A9Q1QEY8_9CARY|nr:hypothetical protein Cgig2_033014 [Carnegiea gigantea]
MPILLFASQFRYPEFLKTYTAYGADLEQALEPYKIKDVVAEYTDKVTDLGARLLDITCEGLRIEHGRFANELSKDLDLLVNHDPVSPDPTLTLGIGRHSDRSLINDVPGLQILTDGECHAVEPTPDALIVTQGYILQVVSNGKLKNGDHRVVTNTKSARESAALFICPSQDFIVEPVKALLDENNPPIYKPTPYHEFLKSYVAGRQSKKDSEDVLKPFRIIHPLN